MTAARQQRKSARPWAGVWWRYFRTRRQLGGYRIEVNAHTGLPISGFSGGLFHRRQTEYWPGLHTAFRRLQSVAIARGRVSVPRHPCGDRRARLYLFYSAEARTAFLVDPGRITERATRK